MAALLHHSSLYIVRNTRNPFLTAAISDTVTGWAKFTAALAECDTQLDRLVEMRRQSAKGPADLAAEYTARILRGEPLGDTFVADITNAEVNHDQVQRALALINRMVTSLEGQRDAAVQAAADRILAHLHGALAALMDQVRQLNLGSAVTADDAFAQGHADGWARYLPLRAQHLQLREAQRMVMKDLSVTGLSELDTFAYFKDYAQDFPDWQLWAGGNGTSSFERGGPVEHHRPTPPWPIADADRFRWLIDHPATRVWIPTGPQLREVVVAAHKANRPHLALDRAKAGATANAAFAAQTKADRESIRDTSA